METAMRNVTINDRQTPASMSPQLIKSEPTLQDQPLDFSTKRVRRRSVDNDDLSIRKVSNDSAIDVSESSHMDSSTSHSHAEESGSQNTMGQSRIPIPPSSVQMPNINTFLPQQTTSMAGMGMFYPHGAPVFPNFLPPGFPGSPMWPNPVAMMQQQEAARKLLTQAAANQSKHLQNGNPGMRPSFNGKPFMGKPGDIMGMAAMGRPFPGMSQFQTPISVGTPQNLGNVPDPGILAEALKSHEEMYSAYKQQVLTQKATDDAKRGGRRQPAATVTNGNHSVNNGTPSAPIATSVLPECSSSLSQISEDQESLASPDLSLNVPISRPPPEQPLFPGSMEEGSMDMRGQTSSSSEDGKNSRGGSTGEVSAAGLPINGNGAVSTSSSVGPSLHSSDESLQTNHGRRSLTPSHPSYGYGELNDITGMRPRSMTLPTQTLDSRMLSHSPSPSMASNGNTSSGPGTPNSRSDRGFRKRARTLPDDQKVKKRDDAYWERRRKNNEAAKRSRDSRRAKEDEIAIRAAFLEQENIRLRLELASLKTQTAKLRSELIIFQEPGDSLSQNPNLPSENGS